MNQREIEAFLDEGVTRVVEELKAKATEDGTDGVVLQGAIAGFLIKTGLALAAHGGCPRRVMEAAVSASIAEAYGGKVS